MSRLRLRITWTRSSWSRCLDLWPSLSPIWRSTLLIAGRVENAVLSEALATAVVLQAKDQDKPLPKAFALDEAWKRATSSA